VAWWQELTDAGGEGMVVKPLQFVSRNKRGLVQPAVKCRGKEYLRIIYGPEYTAPQNLERLRSRGLGTKRSLALREFALGMEALQRFVEREPRGPREQYKAAELESYLRDQFYDGRSFWRLFEPVLRWGFFVLFALLAAREWFAGRAREIRLRRQEMWPESYRDSDHGWGVVKLVFSWSGRLLKRGTDTVAELIRKGMPNHATSSVAPTTETKLQLPRQLSPAIASEPNAKATLTARPNVFPTVAAEQSNTHSQAATTTAPSSPPKKPVKRHSIFPGNVRQKTADEQPASWDESQWID
jgi:hypothetical protein